MLHRSSDGEHSTEQVCQGVKGIQGIEFIGSQGLVLCCIPEFQKLPRLCFHVCRSRPTCSLLWKPDVIVMFVGHARRVDFCGSGTPA